jgi:alpha-tubulin suppressor-like RCC1 family protein
VRLTIKAFVAALALCGSGSILQTSTAHAASSEISTVYTWGGSDGDTAVAVGDLPSEIVDVQAANWGGLAIDSSGDVYQWNAGASPEAIEETASGFSDAVSVGEGKGFSAAVTSSGELWTWGDENDYGDLCQGITDGTTTDPTQVSEPPWLSWRLQTLERLGSWKPVRSRSQRSDTRLS